MTTPAATGAGDIVPVHLLALPVPLAEKAREHFDGLTRELFLIATSTDDEHHVPARLMRLVDALTAQYGSMTSEADQRLEDAIDAGALTITDHVLALPREAGPAAEALGDLIDEADRYCSDGEHLLTLVTPADCLAYRQWYLGQVVGQLRGEPAVPWPDSAPARDLPTT